MSNLSSLCSVEKWYNEIIRSNRHKPIIFVVGTKRELLCDSVLHFIESEGIRVANKIGAEYWSVSAATGFMIQQLFTRIAVVNFENIIDHEMDHEMDVLRSVDSYHGEELSSDDDESASPPIDTLLSGQSNWNDNNSRRKSSL